MYLLILFIWIIFNILSITACLVGISELICLYSLSFLIFSVLENKIYLAFGMLQIWLPLGMGNFPQTQHLFWVWYLAYFLDYVVINFLVALEQGYESYLGRGVILYFYLVSFFLQLFLSYWVLIASVLGNLCCF